MDVAQCFQKSNIKHSTIELYRKNLMSLNNNKPITSTTFLKDPSKILQKIAHFKPTTQRSYIISVVSFLKCQPSSKTNKKMFDDYTKIMNEMNENLRTNNEKSEAEKANWITADEIKTRYNELKAEVAQILKGKTTLKEAEYNKLLQLVVFSLYFLVPPRRNADYQKMKFKPNETETETETDYNYIDLKNRKFIFNNFKTNKTYKTQIIDITPELLEVIKMYLRFVPDDAEYFLVKHNGQHLRLINDITRILNSIFGRKIGSSMLRKMHHTHKFGEVFDALEKDAEQMGHSVDVVKTHYLKR